MLLVASTSASVAASAPTIICVLWPAGAKRRFSALRLERCARAIWPIAARIDGARFSGASRARPASVGSSRLIDSRSAQRPGLLDQPRAGLGDRLEVDVAGEAVVAAQRARDADQLLHRVVGRPHHAGREEQALDVVALVELERQRHDLLDGEARARRVRAAAVHAIGAVVEAPVGEQDLQQRDAAAVRRVGVADAGAGGRPQPLRTAGAPRSARGGAGGVVFRGVGEDAEAGRRASGPCGMFTIRSAKTQREPRPVVPFGERSGRGCLGDVRVGERLSRACGCARDRGRGPARGPRTRRHGRD